MKSLKILLLCMLLACPAFASEWRCDASGGVKYQAAERTIELPQDQDKLYCTVFGTPTEASQLESWFDANPDLARLKQGSHYAVVNTDSVMFRTRYAANTESPCIRIQDAKGTVIYQCSGRSLPLTSESLANSIETNCFRRQPAPQPNYNVYVHYPTPDVQPDKQPDIKKESSMYELPTWAFFAIGIVACISGIGAAWHKEYVAQKGKN